MQNIQERLTGLWPATGASSRRIARFAVIISASLTAGLTTSVDMGKAKSIENGIFLKNHGFSACCPAFFFQKLNMSGFDAQNSSCCYIVSAGRYLTCISLLFIIMI